MKYFYTNEDGFRTELTIDFEDDYCIEFVDAEINGELVYFSYFVSVLIDEISLSGEELQYCIQCAYDSLDREFGKWEFIGGFPEAEVLRFQQYVNAVIADMQEEGDDSDPFFAMTELTLEDAYNLIAVR